MNTVEHLQTKRTHVLCFRLRRFGDQQHMVERIPADRDETSQSDGAKEKNDELDESKRQTNEERKQSMLEDEKRIRNVFIEKMNRTSFEQFSIKCLVNSRDGLRDGFRLVCD